MATYGSALYGAATYSAPDGGGGTYGVSTYGLATYGGAAPSGSLYGAAAYGSATYSGAAAGTVPIVYLGYTPLVCVPTWGLMQVRRGVPVEVPEAVAADLTLGGQSAYWQSGG